jgi:hypothetical protein
VNGEPLNEYDIRQRQSLETKDLLALNFIRSSTPFVFRRHYRTGLRSHLFEVLKPADVQKETEGIRNHECLIFPRARPVKMLRLFRTRFRNLEEALEEIARVQLIIRYLAPDHVAKSNEFLATYQLGGTREILLCGLQEYIPGEILDPWAPLDDQALAEIVTRADPLFPDHHKISLAERIKNVTNQVRSFVANVKRMITKAAHIPDLAGIGNLILTANGQLKLVDINNISPVSPEKPIFKDEHGYPVCDKSFEALALLEKKILGNPTPEDDTFYKVFLEPKRMRLVSQLVRAFTLSPDKRM